eukprot:5546794-Amphidinium_carterae.1
MVTLYNLFAGAAAATTTTTTTRKPRRRDQEKQLDHREHKNLNNTSCKNLGNRSNLNKDSNEGSLDSKILEHENSRELFGTKYMRGGICS